MDKQQGFRIVPSQALPTEQLLEWGLNRRDCEGEVKIVDESGQVYGGAFAVNYFLFKHPPWTILVLIINIIPILLLFEIILYKIIARNRTTISRWLGLAACKITHT